MLCMHETKIHDIGDQRKRLMQTWFDFDQDIIDTAIHQWRDHHIWDHVHAVMVVYTLNTCCGINVHLYDSFTRTFYETVNAQAYLLCGLQQNQTALTVFRQRLPTAASWNSVRLSYLNDSIFIMAALWNRAGHYIYSAKNLKLRRVLETLCGAFERRSRVGLYNSAGSERIWMKFDNVCLVFQI